MGTDTVHQVMMDAVLNLTKQLIPKNANVPTQEGDSIASLLRLFLSPRLDSNPHDIMRGMSDNLVEHIIINREKIPDHPMMKMIFQLFLFEWCFRNDYMLEDWKWEWDLNGKSGKAKLNPRVPLSQIQLPNP